MRSFLIGTAIVGAMLSSTSVAMADGPGRAHTVETSESGDNYGYKFGDDLLTSGMMDGLGVVMKVREGVVRRTLIRPRTHFVPELLKSIELI